MVAGFTLSMEMNFPKYLRRKLKTIVWNMFKVNNINTIVPVFLLLTLNIFYTYFLVFLLLTLSALLLLGKILQEDF